MRLSARPRRSARRRPRPWEAEPAPKRPTSGAGNQSMEGVLGSYLCGAGRPSGSSWIATPLVSAPSAPPTQGTSRAAGGTGATPPAGPSRSRFARALRTAGRSAGPPARASTSLSIFRRVSAGRHSSGRSHGVLVHGATHHSAEEAPPAETWGRAGGADARDRPHSGARAALGPRRRGASMHAQAPGGRASPGAAMSSFCLRITLARALAVPSRRAESQADQRRRLAAKRRYEFRYGSVSQPVSRHHMPS
jgi:hypothetical protein